MMKTPLEHYFIVHSYPDGFMQSELARWLMSLGVPQNQWRIWRGEDRNNQCSYNAAMKWLLHSQHEYDQFVLCDCDIRPHESKMAEFWSSEADLVGVRYPTECEGAFDHPDSIHTALWRTTRQTMQAVEDEFGTWFEWEYDDQQTRTINCLCQSLVKKAKKLGLTVQQAGYAMHVPRRKVR